ncbi:MAG: tetratricopeptide repeat protein [bacterium]
MKNKLIKLFLFICLILLPTFGCVRTQVPIKNSEPVTTPSKILTGEEEFIKEKPDENQKNVINVQIQEFTNKIENDPNNPEWYVRRANQYEKLGKVDKSMQDIDTALSIDENFAPAYNLRGVIKALYFGKPKEGISDYTKAIDLNGMPEAYRNRAIQYIKFRKPDEALQDLTNAIKAKPDYYQAYSDRGELLRLMEQFDLAMNDLNKSIELNPDYYQAYINRGVSYAQGYRNFDKAILDFKTAIKLNDKPISAYKNLGLTYDIIGKKDEARKYYNLVVEEGGPEHKDDIAYAKRKLKELE